VAQASPAAIGVGARGCDSADECLAFERALRALGPSLVRVVNDAELLPRPGCAKASASSPAPGRSRWAGGMTGPCSWRVDGAGFSATRTVLVTGESVGDTVNLVTIPVPRLGHRLAEAILEAIPAQLLVAALAEAVGLPTCEFRYRQHDTKLEVS
jgi:hypothetical protein